MRNRDWFELAARLLGFWLLIQGVVSTVAIPFYAFAGQIALPWYMILFQWTWPVLQSLFGIALIFFASAIAERLYPNDQLRPQEDPAFADGPANEDGRNHALRIGIQLIGVVALLMAVQSVGTLAEQLIRNRKDLSSTGYSGGYRQALISFGANLVFGVGLIAWNDRIIALIEKIRYVPERDAFDSAAANQQSSGSTLDEDS